MKIVCFFFFLQGNLILAGSGESYLIGLCDRDAQGASKTGYYVWKPNSHPLWRGVSASSFFDQHWTPKNAIATEIRFIQRNNRYTVEGNCFCYPLPNHSWSRTHRDNTVVATQWSCTSVPERTARVTPTPAPSDVSCFAWHPRL